MFLSTFPPKDGEAIPLHRQTLSPAVKMIVTQGIGCCRYEFEIYIVAHKTAFLLFMSVRWMDGGNWVHLKHFHDD